MSTVKRTYGRKAKPILNTPFFDSSPHTPEPRRSPRLRRVLGEKSHNVQKLAKIPQLSPSKSQVKVVIRQKETDVVPIVLDSEDEEDHIDKPLQITKQKRNTEVEKGEQHLNEALAELAISTPDARPFERFKEASIPRSVTRRPASSAFSTRKLPRLLRQRSITLDNKTESYISPITACKNVSKVVESFSGWVEERLALLAFIKIGEGSYGQVFRATDASGETVIIKLMPLNAQKGNRWQSFTSIDSAATEIQLLEKMQQVPGYVEFRGACVLCGSMPEHFISLWHEYMESGRTVESRDPRNSGAYPSTQLWLMLELSDAGTNLEPGQYLPPGISKVPKNGKYMPIDRIWDVFWQVTHAVAKAEVYCEFEHRDLHLGNICVRDQPVSPSSVHLTAPFPINSSGILVTIIDYTLSRANMDTSCTLAFDFQSDADLLSGQGDLQYDIYRWMDEVIGERGCKTYDPRTNVLWLYHLLDKLLAVTTGAPRGKRGESMRKMRGILKEVQEMIEPEEMMQWMANSAGDLLQCAYAQEWIVGEEA